jgi:hypothetical protein
VRPKLVRAGRTLALPTLSLFFVIAFFPGHAVLAGRIYMLLLAGFVLALAVEALCRPFPQTAPLRRHSTGPARQPRPGTLRRLEQEVALGMAGAFDLHHRLRPRVRGLAKELLASRRGLSLDDEAQRARRALGDETWDLVRRDRLPPDDRLARGMPPDELSRVVESLERL